MSVIKPRTRGKRLVKYNTRLDDQNQETLYAYAQFLGESTEYVVNQLIDTVSPRTRNSSAGVRTIRTVCPGPAAHVPTRAHRVKPVARQAPESSGTVGA